jgi:hypothetical protein
MDSPTPEPRQPVDPASPGAARPWTPGRLACALPFLVGLATVIGLLVLFYYLLLVW